MLEEVTEPAWGPVGKEVYERTYRRSKEDGTPETWADTVSRVVRGNTGLVAERFIEQGEREKLFDLIYNFKAIPAGRHLWVSGVPGRQFLFNCHRAAFSEQLSEHYAFTFDQLMQGGGVGANYSERYVEHYPTFNSTTNVHIVCDEGHPDYEEIKPYLSEFYSNKWDGCHSVEDSREGWVDALCRLVDSYDDLVAARDIVLDVSPVRERGRPIRGFGGVASGPTALAIMLKNVARVINDRVGGRLTGLDHMQIDHEIAACVVAGNVRRSARMSIKSWKDQDIFEFINCKANSDSHWTTNISVEIDDEFFKALKKKSHELHSHARAVYRAVVTGMLTNGEPGFYNITLASEGEVGDVGSTNPCGEIALEPWENCNLGHVNVESFANDFEGSLEAFRLMTRFLIRATFGDIPNPLQREVVDRNRRIGVGFFGFQGWLVRNGVRFSDSHRNRYVRKTLRDWKSVVDKEKRRYAFQLRIPEPIKGTTLAPTGSIAKLPGATEGGHTIYSPYFIRSIRYSQDDAKVASFVEEGYETEPDLYTSNTTVVKFYCKDPLLESGVEEELVEGANDVAMEDMLAVQAMYQECYADNAVSFTVNVEAQPNQVQHVKDEIAAGKQIWEVKMVPPPEEVIEEAMKTILHYLPHVKGTTIMVDGSRPQAPYTRITKAEYELAEYMKTVDSGYDECKTGACPVK